MKAILLSITVLGCSLCYAQNIAEADSKLIQVFGESTVKEIYNNNPGLYNLYKVYSRSGLVISNFNFRFKNAEKIYRIPLRQKGEYISVDEFLENVKSTDFNPLQYAFLPETKDLVYQLGDSELFLLIPSQNSLLNNSYEINK